MAFCVCWQNICKKKKKKVSQIENIQFWLKHAHANFFFPPLDDGETALRADGTL